MSRSAGPAFTLASHATDLKAHAEERKADFHCDPPAGTWPQPSPHRTRSPTHSVRFRTPGHQRLTAELREQKLQGTHRAR